MRLRNRARHESIGVEDNVLHDHVGSGGTMSNSPQGAWYEPARVRRSRRFCSRLEPLESRFLLSGTTFPEPTADEQYMLELLNRARANPVAEAQWLLTVSQTDPTIRAALSGWDASAFLQEMTSHGSSPPLAFNPRLIAASHAQDAAMVASNLQFHSNYATLARPTNASQLAPDGQPYFPSNESSWSMAENVFAYSGNLPNPHGASLDLYFHEAFLLDWGNPDFGHLRNLLLPGPSGASASGRLPVSEIGIGILTDAYPSTSPTATPDNPLNRGLNVGPALVTEELAWRSGHEFLTGVFYNDRDGNNFYTPGEGLGGVTIRVVGTHGEGVFTTQTWGSGGYSLDLPSGTYNVTASGGGLARVETTSITIGIDNVGWDVKVPPTPVTPPSSSPTSEVVSFVPPVKLSSSTAKKGPMKRHIVKPVRHPRPLKWHRHH